MDGTPPVLHMTQFHGIGFHSVFFNFLILFKSAFFLYCSPVKHEIHTMERPN